MTTSPSMKYSLQPYIGELVQEKTGLGARWALGTSAEGSLQPVPRVSTWEVNAHVPWISSVKRETIKERKSLTRNPKIKNMP